MAHGQATGRSYRWTMNPKNPGPVSVGEAVVFAWLESDGGGVGASWTGPA